MGFATAGGGAGGGTTTPGTLAVFWYLAMGREGFGPNQRDLGDFASTNSKLPSSLRHQKPTGRFADTMQRAPSFAEASPMTTSFLPLRPAAGHVARERHKVRKPCGLERERSTLVGGSLARATFSLNSQCPSKSSTWSCPSCESGACAASTCWAPSCCFTFRSYLATLLSSLGPVRMEALAAARYTMALPFSCGHQNLIRGSETMRQPCSCTHAASPATASTTFRTAFCPSFSPSCSSARCQIALYFHTENRFMAFASTNCTVSGSAESGAPSAMNHTPEKFVPCGRPCAWGLASSDDVATTVGPRTGETCASWWCPMELCLPCGRFVYHATRRRSSGPAAMEEFGGAS
mmetsp:Transcript_29293/g.83266  ORF Transcript_29293/g.83266 Transcript_29293/m.83266 type:complete len:349 (-) Transcript_29293:946-1992(-)